MPDNEWDEMLVEATGEVLETMFFTGVYGPAQDGGAAAEPRVAARLSFEGTPSGALTLSISEPAMRALTANFLASDQDDALPAAQLGCVVCELANMICGSLLSRVESATTFHLAAPRIVPPTGCPAPGRDTSFYAVDLSNGTLTVAVTTGTPTCPEPAQSAS
jgi:CheY-specific phosphatase CheX